MMQNWGGHRNKPNTYMPSLNQKPPSGFNAIIGAAVPNSVTTALQPYEFAMVQGKLVIVNPSDKKIAEVITG